jgi:hypothetical protein
MAGAILIIVALIVVIPVGFLMTMSLVAGLLGWSVESEVDDTWAGTEWEALGGTDATS